MKKQAPNSNTSSKDQANHGPTQPSSSSIPGTPEGHSRAPVASTLTISRNKHWRYISAFHGPWLQLPHEILETLAHSNFLSPRPRQTDPGVLYDLLKIRGLVDEASSLAVRAQNGTASSALSNSRDDGLPGGSLGLSYRGGGNAKLSPERKYRMRELATQKLSQAYRIDEVAASVATMQAASALDNVATFVLHRNPGATDGKYVHFFHEKIPSRMMAEYTPLDSLHEVVRSEPTHPAPLRTRALTKIFKEDYRGAIQDLTEALALCRLQNAKHRAGGDQLVTMQTARQEAEKRKTWTKDWMHENKVADEDQPNSLEMQLLFQRGILYLNAACQYSRQTIDGLIPSEEFQGRTESEKTDCDDERPSCSAHSLESLRNVARLQELVRTNAKRALKDYTSFLSSLDYATVPAQEVNETVGQNGSANGLHQRHAESSPDLRATGSRELDDNLESSNALVKRAYSHPSSALPQPNGTSNSPMATNNPVSEVLSASPPSNLPQFPAPPGSLQHRELTTYHPLLPEVLHSFLLAHCLLKTPRKTLTRISLNVARIARLADGYPFFLSARSPAKADWCEVLRKTQGRWISLVGNGGTKSNAKYWETLCNPSQRAQQDSEDSERIARMLDFNGGPLQSTAAQQTAEVTEAQMKDKIHKESILDALHDDRVVDGESFQQAVEARDRRAWKDGEVGSKISSAAIDANGKSNEMVRDNNGDAITASVRRSASAAKDEAYLIGTERAEAIARWVLEAPEAIVGPSSARKKKTKTKPQKTAAVDGETLGNEVNALNLE